MPEKKKRRSFDHMEEELRQFHDLKREIHELEKDIILSTASGGEGSSSHMVSDPVGRMVTTLDTHKRLKYLKHVTGTIEKVYQELPEEQQKLIRVRYWNNRHLNWDGICQELNVHFTTAIRWRKVIIIRMEKALGWKS